jgi:hypothetical protein
MDEISLGAMQVAIPWLCESIRLTYMWADTRSVSGPLNWEAVVGAPPEQRQDQPRMQMLREFGPIDDGLTVLEFRVTPGRVDWLVSPITPVGDSQQSFFQYFKPVPEVLRRFEELLFAKAEAGYDAVRIATGVVAVHPTTSHSASYAELDSLLPDVTVPTSGVSELIFQVNRPRPSAAIPGATLNRLSKWSCAAISGFQVSPVAGVPIASMSNAFYSTRVELDLSTPADNRLPIAQDLRGKVTTELFTLANEILTEGDIP